MTEQDRFHIRLPLLAKMLVLLLSVAVVPLIIVGAMSIRRGVDAVGRTAEQNLQVIASTAGARLDQVLSQAQRLQAVVATTETVVKAFSAPPTQRKDLLPGVEQWLKEVLSCDPDLELAYVADEQGICLVSTSPDMVGRDYKATREYMRRALGGENVISDLAMGITTREPGVFLAGPVRDQNGKLVGVVVLKLKGNVIDRVCLDVSKETAQGFAVVIDANEIIISHPDPERLYHSIGTLSPEALKQIDPKLQYGVERIESAGQDDLARALRQGHNRGYLMGIIGSEDRMQGAVVADAVNLAARIEGLNKMYGSYVSLSDETFFAMKEPDRYRHRFIDKVRVKGRVDAVTVYEVFEGDPEGIAELKEQTKPAFESGLQIYYGKKFSEASVHFNQVLEKNPADLAARIYLKRCPNYMVNGVPPDWTGVETLLDK